MKARRYSIALRAMVTHAALLCFLSACADGATNPSQADVTPTKPGKPAATSTANPTATLSSDSAAASLLTQIGSIARLDSSGQLPQASDGKGESGAEVITDHNIHLTSITMPLYYFTDAARVIQIIRPDATFPNAPQYNALVQAANAAQLDVQQGDQDRLTKLNDLNAKKSALAASQAREQTVQNTASLAQKTADLADEANNVQQQKVTSLTTQQQTETDPTKAAALLAQLNRATADAQITTTAKTNADNSNTAAQQALKDQQTAVSTATDAVSTAQSTLADAVSALSDAQTTVTLSVAKQQQAEEHLAGASLDAVATMNPTAADPIQRVYFHTSGASVIYLEGTPADVAQASLAISQLDTPVPQARATLWKIQLNGEGVDASKRKRDSMDASIATVEEDMSYLQKQLAASAAVFRASIEAQVDQLDTGTDSMFIDEFGNHIPDRINFFDKPFLTRLNKEAKRDGTVYGKEVDCQDNTQLYWNPDEMRTNALGEMLVRMLLSTPAIQRSVFETYFNVAPQAMADLAVEHQKHMERIQPCYKPESESCLLNHFQDVVQAPQLLAAFGLRRKPENDKDYPSESVGSVIPLAGIAVGRTIDEINTTTGRRDFVWHMFDLYAQHTHEQYEIVYFTNLADQMKQLEDSYAHARTVLDYADSQLSPKPVTPAKTAGQTNAPSSEKGQAGKKAAQETDNAAGAKPTKLKMAATPTKRAAKGVKAPAKQAANPDPAMDGSEARDHQLLQSVHKIKSEALQDEVNRAAVIVSTYEFNRRKLIKEFTGGIRCDVENGFFVGAAPVSASELEDDNTDSDITATRIAQSNAKSAAATSQYGASSAATATGTEATPSTDAASSAPTASEKMYAEIYSLQVLSPTNVAVTSVGDQLIREFVDAAESDLDDEFIEPALQKMRQDAQNKWIELSIIDRTSILAGDRRFARVDPKADVEYNFPPPVGLEQEAVDLAKLALKSASPLGLAGSAVASDALNALSGGGNFLEKLNGLDQNATTPQPNIYSIETGNGFELTPILLPDAQNVAFNLDYTLSSPVSDPEKEGNRHIAQIERHSVQTYVQDESYQVREISRFDTTTHLKEPVIRSGGIPLLRELPIFRDIPLIGWFSETGHTGSSHQESLIFIHTVQYPTVSSLINLF